LTATNFLARLKSSPALAFVVSEHKAVSAVRRVRHDKLIERGKDQIGALEVLLAAAGEHHGVDRHAVVVERVERSGEYLAPVRLDRRQ
jgi:hypothetical protein